MQFRSLISFIMLYGITFGGFSQLDFSGYEWQLYDTKNSTIKNKHISEVFIDSKERVWVTTGGQSMAKFENGKWQSVHFPFTGGAWFNSIVEDDQGKFYIAGNPNRLLTYDPNSGRWDSIPTPGEQPWKLARSPKGTIAIGCTTPGSRNNLYLLQNDSLVGMNDDFEDVFTIVFTPNGDLLAAFRKGLFRYALQEDGTYASKPKKLSNLAFYNLDFDSKGNLWAAAFSTTHLHSLIDGKWTEYVDGPKDLYYDFNGRWKYLIHDVMVLPDDRILISSQFGAGIAVFDGETWESYQLPTNGAFDGISNVIMDPEGNVWCCTARHGLALFKAPFNNRSGLVHKREKTESTNDYTFVSDGEENTFFDGEKRKLTTKQSLDITERLIRLEIRDNKTVDHDIVTIFFNGAPLMERVQLSGKPIQLSIVLEEGNNELVFFAHNLGRIPPNTASVKLTYGAVTEELELSSTLKSSERIIIWSSP